MAAVSLVVVNEGYPSGLLCQVLQVGYPRGMLCQPPGVIGQVP